MPEDNLLIEGGEAQRRGRKHYEVGPLKEYILPKRFVLLTKHYGARQYFF